MRLFQRMEGSELLCWSVLQSNNNLRYMLTVLFSLMLLIFVFSEVVNDACGGVCDVNAK